MLRRVPLVSACLAIASLSVVETGQAQSDITLGSWLEQLPIASTRGLNNSKFITDYFSDQRPKALAFAPAQSNFFRWYGDDAVAKALARCRDEYKEPCALISDGNRAVVSGEAGEFGFGNEKMNWGVSPAESYQSNVHSPTPTTILGARVIHTPELIALLQNQLNTVLVDVLTGAGAPSIPKAVRAPGGGVSFPDSDPRAKDLIEGVKGHAGGDLNRDVVVFCLSSKCWLSYNAALRLARAGFRNIYWYRGGLNSWRLANQPIDRRAATIHISGPPSVSPGSVSQEPPSSNR